MEYPGSKFTKIWRKIIFTLFIVAFLIISPLLIAYTMGYRWQHGLIKETGAMSIDILPKNATIYVNEQKIKDTMPVRLNSITPHTYTIRISAPGYYDWYEEAEVKNKQTVYIKEIELIKKNKPELVHATSTHGLYLSPKNNYLIYHQDQTQKTELRLLNLENNTDVLVKTLPPKDEYQVKWSDDEKYFSIYKELPVKDLTLFDISAQSTEINLAEEIKNPIQKFQWLANGSTSELYLSTSSSHIINYTPRTKEQKIIATSHFLDWHVASNNIFFLETNTSTNRIELTRTSLNNQQKETIPLTGDQFLLTNPSIQEWHIEKVINNDSILLEQVNQTASYLVTPSSKFNLSTSQSLTSDYNNWLLLWSAWELWSYNEGENPNLLNRSGEQLRSVFPLDKYNTLLLIWDKKSSIFFPYYRVMHDFLPEEMADVQVDSRHKVIYFTNLDPQKKGLWKVAY